MVLVKALAFLKFESDGPFWPVAGSGRRLALERLQKPGASWQSNIT